MSHSVCVCAGAVVLIILQINLANSSVLFIIIVSRIPIYVYPITSLSFLPFSFQRSRFSPCKKITKA